MTITEDDGAAGAAGSSGGSGSAASGWAADASLSAPMRLLVRAVAELGAQQPADLPGAQALVEAGVLLEQLEVLRTLALARVADVDVRQLHALDGAPSTATWVARQQSSMDRGQVALARRLAGFPLVQSALLDRRLSVEVGRRVIAALTKLRRHVDRPDGLIDGQDGELVVTAVVTDGVRQLVCEALGGLADDDQRLVLLRLSLDEVAGRPVSQLSRLEAAFVLLAEHVEPALLPSCLSQLLDALLPNELERRARDAHQDRGFGMRRNDDGSGWTITDGDLDAECGELLDAFLRAELAVDPDNPEDTAGYEQLRAEGWKEGDDLPRGGASPRGAAPGEAAPGTAPGGGAPEDGSTGEAAPACAGPRSLRQRRHDALRNGLRRYLDSGIAGLRDKVVPHVSVTVGLDALEGKPGALPARGASGARLPASLVGRWACDSAVTRFVMSLGHRVLAASHTQRTLSGIERRARQIETGGRCQGAGCTRGPGHRLIPHHATPWATSGTTSRDDTIMLCEQTHADLHLGRTAIQLKDGRWLDADGWTTKPSTPTRDRQ